MSNYAKADRATQWFASAYPGSPITPNCGVLHTTETTWWPTYAGGASAPTYTARPDVAGRRLLWRAHFPDEMSSRALQNLSGGVETNKANAVQVELVGTCDPQHRTSWLGQGTRFAGKDYLYWPEAPDWALADVADFLLDQHARHGIALRGTSEPWVAYPKSYGYSAPQRMTFDQWRAFYGWCGHQHVPENDHGDPGALNFARILTLTTTATEDDDMATITEDNARDLFTGFAILKDTRAANPDTAPRVAPSALLEYAAAQARANALAIAALKVDPKALAAAIAEQLPPDPVVSRTDLEAALRTVLGSVDEAAQ